MNAKPLTPDFIAALVSAANLNRPADSEPTTYDALVVTFGVPALREIQERVNFLPTGGDGRMLHVNFGPDDDEREKFEPYSLVLIRPPEVIPGGWRLYEYDVAIGVTPIPEQGAGTAWFWFE